LRGGVKASEGQKTEKRDIEQGKNPWTKKGGAQKQGKSQVGNRSEKRCNAPQMIHRTVEKRKGRGNEQNKKNGGGQFIGP